MSVSKWRQKRWKNVSPGGRLDRDVEETDSDGDVQWQVSFPVKRTSLEDAVRTLQAKNEDQLIEDVLSSFQALWRPSEDKAKSSKVIEPLDTRRLTRTCIRSWRTERNIVSQYLTKGKQKRSAVARSLSERRTHVSKQKCTANPDRLKLKKFLNSLQAGMEEAEANLKRRNVSDNRNFKKEQEEFMLRRPSQLIQLQETDGGSETDHLRGARKQLLGKLSKQCAVHMVNRHTPLNHREALRGLLEEVHGARGDDCYCGMVDVLGSSHEAESEFKARPSSYMK